MRIAAAQPYFACRRLAAACDWRKGLVGGEDGYMHIHPNQNNLNIQINALEAAEKAAAQREAAETRRKLREFSAKTAAESAYGEDCVVKLGARQESQEQAKGRGEAEKGPEGGPKADTGGGPAKPVSEWA